MNQTSIHSFTHFPLIVLAACVGVAAYASPVQGIVADSATMAKPLTVGAMVPDATLQALNGKNVSLTNILKRKRTVLIFYRGGWCPYCNAHLSDLVTIEKQVTDRGFQIIAISPDTPSELNKTLTKDHLNYKLFSDSSAEAMKKFGVAYRLDDPTFTKMRDSFGVDLEKSSGQTHHILPVPSVFVVGKDGKIVYVHSNPDYKVRLKGSEILSVIASM
jgi:peroxiredoxin